MNSQEIKSYAYIRCNYVIGFQEIKGKWFRIYPKPEKEIILYPHPIEFGQLKTNPKRYFEVMKRHYRRSFIGTHNDFPWELNLHVCNEIIDEKSSY